MKKVAVILSGSGHQDGTEIHEAVIAVLALDRAGCEVVYFAPDKTQAKVQNHIKHVATQETRNVLIESARIARGDIKHLSELEPTLIDGVVIPGGFGAALNLCDFASKGAKMTVDPMLVKKLKGVHSLAKPIAAICIAPVILAGVFGELKPVLTIGNDEETAAALTKLGVKHQECSAEDCVVDETLKFITSPAYMLGRSPKEIAPGIEKLVAEFVRLMG